MRGLQLRIAPQHLVLLLQRYYYQERERLGRKLDIKEKSLIILTAPKRQDSGSGSGRPTVDVRHQSQAEPEPKSPHIVHHLQMWARKIRYFPYALGRKD